MDDLLFYGRAYLSQALDAQGRKMREAIDGEPEESLKQVDVDAWAASWAHHFAVACPVLRPDEKWMDAAKDIKIDVSGIPSAISVRGAGRSCQASGSSSTSPSRARRTYSSCSRTAQIQARRERASARASSC